MDRTSLKKHVTSASFLLKYNLPSVNQLAVEIKLTEAWKSTNVDLYPVKMEPFNQGRPGIDRTVRTGTRKLWNDEANTAAKLSFIRDTAKLWNNAPEKITNAANLSCAKSEIKKYCKLLEI